MKRLFLDANIVIDALLRSGDLRDNALRILSLSETGQAEVFCSSLSLATASYFMEKAKMDHDEIVDRLNIFCEYCTPTRVDADIVHQALDSVFTDFEDALQYFSALSESVDVIITRNSKDFSASLLPVMTAAEFLTFPRQEW